LTQVDRNTLVKYQSPITKRNVIRYITIEK